MTGIIFALIFRFTTLGLYVQTVGINQGAARLNGINSVWIKLLAFIIIRSMWTSKKTEEVPEQPEELSVEQLLESQPEEVLTDIEMDQGSETKRLIEKFVDENPEAAATLLRNWLNEDFI